VAATRQKELLPIDLGSAPEVDRLLVRLGLGPFRRESVRSPIGRNDAWTGLTADGTDVFVKRLVGPARDTGARMRRLLSFEEFAAAASIGSATQAAGLRRPAVLGSDEADRLVVFERVRDARNGAELMVEETFTEELAHRVGVAVGRLHTTPVPPGVEVDGSIPPLPPVAFLRGLPMAVYVRSSAGELEAWRILQNDAELADALVRLRAAEVAAPKVPSHCDFRVDQLLVDDDGVVVTDWEEFRLADAARDVGAFAGEWIYRSVLDIVTNRGDEAFVDVEFTHDLIMSRGVAKMQRLLPLVHAFWRGYREVRGHVDPGLPERATAFAGWHLLDRLVAGASSASRLSGIQRAAAGVGRAAVVTPEKFVRTLGFGDL
jgi:aminoglycoside phosphotransferase (APT) family kinase protein